MKSILVTGANKGIGLAIVRALLERNDDTNVFLGSRDEARGHAARDSLRAEQPNWNARLHSVQLDVADDDSVRSAVSTVTTSLDGENLYGIVNNAGIGVGSHAFETVVDVNVHGIDRVCAAFMPLLVDGGRVVNMTSASGPNFVAACAAERQREFIDANVRREQLKALIDEGCSLAKSGGSFVAAGLGDGQAYGFSKACANLLTLLLARENPRLRVNACTPGFIATDLTRPYAEAAGLTPEEMGMKPPSAGTRAPLHLLFGELDGNGRYYGSDAVRSPLDRYRSPGDPPYAGD